MEECVMKKNVVVSIITIILVILIIISFVFYNKSNSKEPSLQEKVSDEIKYLNSYLEYLDNTAIDKIVNIKKNIYKLSDKENFVEKLIDLLNSTLRLKN